MEQTWNPDLGPPFGVMYCVHCECVPVSEGGVRREMQERGVCLFVFERIQKKQIATITVPVIELFVLKW